MNLKTICSYLFCLGLLATTAACNNQGEQSTTDARLISSDKKPQIEFVKTHHDFGQIKDGEKVAYAFRFTNTGEAPLVLQKPETSCGCTVAEYPRHPIKPGEGASIQVEFDATNKPGKNTKSITVVANTEPNRYELTISAEVLPKQ